MKVLQINSVCGLGSTGKICQDLYWELKKSGHECKIAYGRNKGGDIPDEDTIKIGGKIDCYIHAILARLFDSAGFHSKYATKKFIEKIKEYDPDVIHLHNIHGYYINIEILFEYLRSCNKKIIWTLHDCWGFTGHCAHMDFIGCDKWKNKCHDCPQTSVYPKCVFLDRSYENFLRKKECFTNIPNLHIVTPSHWLAGLVKESFLNKYPINVIHNGINVDFFKPSISDIRNKFNLENKIIVLGVAYQWNNRKGYGDMLKLAQLLPKEKYKVVLIGLNGKQIREIPDFVLGLTKI